MDINQLSKEYNTPLVRTLIKLIPIVGSFLDLTISNEFEKAKIKRLRSFFSKLENGNLDLTDEIINNDQFLYCYFKTINSVIFTKRTEKIEYFSNLFKNAIIQSEIFISDEYEELLKILDELSYSEIDLLLRFKKMEDNQEVKEGSNTRYEKLERNKKFFHDFGEEITKETDFDRHDLDTIYIRIERTGCMYIPRMEPNNLSPYSACTTHIFNKLFKFIM
ncbi:hypothetical protein [uncultured Chryseobacterium sp.]|uniref:hypothetical protein n=1 Tax=uncultured Chryseobacterium sp. TaxID=259322 RepID=UPI0025E4AA00|nr:hypothetical protein [uncultured Chryseobacterium sp.]